MSAELEQRALAIGESQVGVGVYWSLRALIRTVLYPAFRLRIEGRENLAAEGPLIIAPVHRSAMDIPLVGAASSRRLKYFAKEELFASQPNMWFLSSLGGVPVDRARADRAALVAAISLLEQGHALVVFPEGTRQTGGEVGELFEGAAYMAARTGARVVPVGVGGTETLTPKRSLLPGLSRVSIVAGAPLDAPSRARVERREFTQHLREALQEVFDRALARSG